MMESEELLSKIRADIRKKDTYQKILKHKNDLLKQRKYVQASQIDKQLKQIEYTAMMQYIEEYKKEQERIKQIWDRMSEDEMDMLTAHSYMLVMLADVVETAAMECKSLFDKYGGCYDTTIYTNLVNVAKESKVLVNELNTIHTDEYSINSYADTADKLYEMALNKAKSFVRKWKEHEERANKKAPRNSKVAQGR